MQAQSGDPAFLRPPTIHMAVPVLAIPDDRVVQVADVPTNLMKSTRFGGNVEQGAARVVAAGEAPDHGAGFAGNAVFIRFVGTSAT